MSIIEGVGGISPKTSSDGLMGLPHFRSSRVSTSMYEPVYLNLFTVQINLPKALTLENEGDNQLLLEGIRKVSGLDTNKVPGAITQKYKMAERSFSESGTQSTHIDVGFTFDVNLRNCLAGQPNLYTIKILRAWNDLVWDPLTGRQGLKEEYADSSAIITMHDKKGQPFWQWRLYGCFPITSLPAPVLDYDSNNSIYKVENYQLRCDVWDEAML